MGDEKDPFEILRRKLEAKKRSAAAEDASKGARAPGPPPARRAPPPASPPPERSQAPARPPAAPKPLPRPKSQPQSQPKSPPTGTPSTWSDLLARANKPGSPPKRKETPAGRAGAGKDPAEKPMRIVRSAWSAEDLRRMEQSKETTKEGPPGGFESHRFDSELDPKRVADRKKEAPGAVRRPKGFTSDRADRG